MPSIVWKFSSVSWAGAALMCLSAFLLLLSPQKASASEWGCKVLLCAASSNPSWRQIDTCIPPMTKLIACRAKFFDPCAWPVCPEAGTGEPGYKKYSDCPTGWSPHHSSGDSNHVSLVGAEADQCIRKVKSKCFGRDCNVPTYETMARPVKTNPYYFDIKDNVLGKNGRHWFSLN